MIGKLVVIKNITTKMFQSPKPVPLASTLNMTVKTVTKKSLDLPLID
jgi:hypothetical protein